MAETETKITQKEKKRRVKALFSYTPVNIDELQLKVNDILEVIEETEEGWWKGVLNGAVGMFPSNFVVELENTPEEISNHALNELSPTKSLAKGKNVDAPESGLRHDITHSPTIKQEIKSANLTTNNNDDVFDSPKVSESVDKKGSVSKKGTLDNAAPRLPPKPVREQARVLYPYTALNEDELSLKEGDIITVISKEVEDKGWWKGELNNKTGVFPDNFVQLIKVDEQRKPERPDKPSSALTSRASLKSSSSDKVASDFSPKADKKVFKTPPIKPPPPEIHKKDHERLTAPFPIKKPQVPHPMKKPSRSSLGAKFSGFSPPAPVNSPKPIPPETPSPASHSAPSPSETKSEVTKSIEKLNDKVKSEVTKNIEKNTDKIKPEVSKNIEKLADKIKPDLMKNLEKLTDKEDKKDTKGEKSEVGFEGLESSGKKLVHLTANRAKVPNRRPPSHIFLRETEKENGIAVDPRRLSEPLLSEMKSILQLGDVESPKASSTGTNEVKAKIPPSRPLPPSIKGNKPAIQGSVVLTKTISSEECIVKAPEPIKKTALPDVSNTSTSEIMQPKKVDLLPSSDFRSSEKEIYELKESLRTLMGATVSRNEFNELAKQVKELKEGLEKCNSICKKTINDLRNELESEKKLRQALELELQKIKECQTT